MTSVKVAAIKLMITALKIVYIPFKALPLKRKVSFISRQSNKPSRDICMLAECIQRDFPDVQVVVLVKKIGPSLPDKIGYVLHMINQLYHIATSRVIVIDGYCIAACVLKHKKDTKVIQMWHALGAVKKFGYQTLGKNSGADERIARAMCMHKNYDYVLSPGGETDRHFMQGFCVEKRKLAHLALPRVDYIMGSDVQTVNKIKSRYYLDEQFRCVLYAPTFRRGGMVNIDRLIKDFDFTKYTLVIKLHPLDGDKMHALKMKFADRKNLIVDDAFDSYQWLQVCDKVVTDYSALAIEASLKNKPLYFYTYDMDQYERNVGLNIDIKNDMRRYLASTSKQLVNLMAEEYDYKQLENFKKKYISASTERCTERIAEFIIDIMGKNEGLC